ncbi:MAG: hypothetical protein EBV10_01430 [Synechococcaceae bacterium WB6_1A_059]|nr:hypothetical protein [Synechococcaceae bacterium WB6_1A_059]
MDFREDLVVEECTITALDKVKQLNQDRHRGALDSPEVLGALDWEVLLLLEVEVVPVRLDMVTHFLLHLLLLYKAVVVMV